jgi:hypothetical protein
MKSEKKPTPISKQVVLQCRICSRMNYQPHAQSLQKDKDKEDKDKDYKAKEDGELDESPEKPVSPKKKFNREDTLVFKPHKVMKTVFTKMEGL